jgi:hypothetical protein
MADPTEQPATATLAEAHASPEAANVRDAEVEANHASTTEEVTTGTGVKYNNAEDVQPIVAMLQGAYTTVRFSDNTFGVEACEAIAAQLQKNSALKVCSHMRGG